MLSQRPVIRYMPEAQTLMGGFWHIRVIRSSLLVVGVGWDRVQLCLNLPFHLPDPGQVWINLSLFQPVKNLLPVHIDFHPAVSTGGNRDSYIAAEGPEELVRHPRGGCVVLSRNAVNDLHMSFTAITCHRNPPLYFDNSGPVFMFLVKYFTVVRLMLV